MSELKMYTVVFFFAFSFFSIAQDKVTGKVVSDKDGNPLLGVMVQVKGTSMGTQTDFDGNYSISAKKGSVLIFLSMRMETIEKSVTSNRVDVVMKEETSQLGEVVVTTLGAERN